MDDGIKYFFIFMLITGIIVGVLGCGALTGLNNPNINEPYIKYVPGIYEIIISTIIFLIAEIFIILVLKDEDEKSFMDFIVANIINLAGSTMLGFILVLCFIFYKYVFGYLFGTIIILNLDKILLWSGIITGVILIKYLIYRLFIKR